MKRSCRELARGLAIAIWLATAGCAFSDGSPWGVADLSLFAMFTPSGAVAVHHLAIDVESMHLEQGFGEEEEHDAHAHEEEEAPAPQQSSVVRPGSDRLVTLGPEPVAIELGACAAECELARGELRSIGVVIHEMELDLTADGRRFGGTVELETEVTADVEGEIDDGEPIGVRARATLTVPGSMFEDIDWTAASTVTDVLEQLQDNLRASGALTVEIERYHE